MLGYHRKSNTAKGAMISFGLSMVSSLFVGLAVWKIEPNWTVTCSLGGAFLYFAILELILDLRQLRNPNSITDASLQRLRLLAVIPVVLILPIIFLLRG